MEEPDTGLFLILWSRPKSGQHRALLGSSLWLLSFQVPQLGSAFSAEVLSDLRGYAFAANFAEFQGTDTAAHIENATEPFGGRILEDSNSSRENL